MAFSSAFRLLPKATGFAANFCHLTAIFGDSCSQKKLFRKFPAFSALLSVVF